MNDRLDGFRAAEDRDLAPGEALLLRQRELNSGLINLVDKSQAMMAWLETPVGRAWQGKIEHALNEAMQVLLRVPTLDSSEARDAHAHARMCIFSFKTMESIINAGPEATALVRASDEQANAELNDNG